MQNYLFFMSNKSIQTQSSWNYRNKYTCREIILRDYDRLMVGVPVEDYPKINLYFGHGMDTKPEIVERYIPFCNEIWKNRFEVSIVNSWDITDSPDIDWCKSEFKKGMDSFGNYPLIKVCGAANPEDLSLLLHTTWYNKVMQSQYLKMYYLARKYSDLIPDWFDFYYNTRPGAYLYVTGPGLYITWQEKYNNKLFNDINKVYEEHKGELN